MTVTSTAGKITDPNVNSLSGKANYHDLSKGKFQSLGTKADESTSISQLIFGNSLYEKCSIEIICRQDGFHYSLIRKPKSGQYKIEVDANFGKKNDGRKLISSNLTSSIFSNSSNISIPAANSNVNGGGAAAPYSSNIIVSGLSGTITDLNVKINGFSHTFPNDIAILLVSPTGAKFILQSDVGGKNDVENITYTFDDQASSTISASAFPGNNDSVQPSSVGDDDVLLSPAPSSPYAHPAPAGASTLNNTFGGLNPNGTWKLFVFDFFAGNSGSITGGWSLEITTNGGIVPPSINSLNPNNRISGGSNFELTVNGNNFNSSSVVRWNGQDKTTTFVSSSQIKAQIPASDIQVIGTYPITVINSQTGAASNAVNFSVIGCSYSLSNLSQTLPVTGGTGSVNITAEPGCVWTATSNNTWITITNGSGSGSGNGTVHFSVAPNNGPTRTGTITIGGETLTITQGNGCSYSLSSSGADFTASGGNGGFDVNSNSNCVWTVQNNNSWISIDSLRSGSGNETVTFSITPNNGQARSGTILIAEQTYTVNQAGIAISNGSVEHDFDGDGKADMAVFRPSNGVWHLLRSQEGYASIKFGLSTDKLAPADYDGDGKTDIAIWREDAGNANLAYFYIMKSTDNTIRVEQFGSFGDSPKVVGDWDGDGKADLSVYRKGVTNNSQSYFFYRPSSQPEINFITIQWGTGNDKPVAADFDGDGRFDAAVYRPSEGIWYVQKSTGGNYSVQFGISEDKVVVGDYDGDGKADQAVFRPSTGIWYILGSSTGFAAAHFGIATDLPVPADYDGDGKTDIAVYRQGTWYQLNSTNGFEVHQFGINSDIPIPGFIVN